MKTRMFQIRRGFTLLELLIVVALLSFLAMIIITQFTKKPVTVQTQILGKLREADARQVMLEPVTEDICNILYLIEDSNVVYHISDVPNKEFDPNCLTKLDFVKSDKRDPNDEEVWVRPGTEEMPSEQVQDTQDYVLNRLGDTQACMVIVQPDETKEGSYKITYLIESYQGEYEIRDIPMGEFDPSCLGELGLVKSDESEPNREVWVKAEKMPLIVPEANEPDGTRSLQREGGGGL